MHMQHSALREFVTAVGQAGATSHMNFGAGLPGLGQGAATLYGGIGTSNEVAHNLHQTVAAFAGAYPKESWDTLVPMAQEIEGQLSMLQTFGSITEAQFETLVTQLNDLMAAKQQ